MNPSEQIDQHIAELADWRGKTMTQLRKLIHTADTEFVEDWKWDTPVFSHKGNVVALAAFKEHVKINFFKGASLSDPKKLFNAGLDAKASRAIDVLEADKIDEAALKDLVRNAAALNLKPKK